MSSPVVVYRGRTTRVQLNLGLDITDQTIKSQIRARPRVDSTLLAEWTVVVDDAETGKVYLTINAEDILDSTTPNGYMDIKRGIGGVFYNVFDKPLEVQFREVVTL